MYQAGKDRALFDRKILPQTARQICSPSNGSLSLPFTMTSFVPHPTDSAAIATIRTLAADVVGKANSGHPG
jgi:hypothetical protein